MQNKTISVELIGENNSGVINSVSSGNISNISSYRPAEITTDDMYSSSGMRDGNIITGYSNILNRNILISPITAITPTTNHSYQTQKNSYIYSDDNGNTWSLLKFYNKNGKTPVSPSEVDGIAYANGYFYACPATSNYTSNYLVSRDCSVWETKSFLSYTRLKWVTQFNSTTILILAYDLINKKTVVYTSEDSGETLIERASINNIELDRIEITDNYIYLYSQYATDVYYSTNNISNLNFSLNSALSGTCDMKFGNISYKTDSGIMTGKRLVAFTINSNNDFIINVFNENGNIIGNTLTMLMPRQGQTVPVHSLNIINEKIVLGIDWQMTYSFAVDGIIIYTDIDLTEQSDFYTYNKNHGGIAGVVKDSNTLVSIKNSKMKQSSSSLYLSESISAYKSEITQTLTDMIFENSPIYMLNDSASSAGIFNSSSISKNNYSISQSDGLVFNGRSSDTANKNGNYDYESTLFVFGNKIQRLLIFFDKSNDRFPTKIIINGDEYSNNDSYFYIDFGYGKYDTIIIQFLELNKPNSVLKIGGINTDVNCVFTRINGLNSVAVASVDETPPYYGIISYSGEIEINDRFGILKILSEKNLLPNMTINIYIQDIKRYTFTSNSNVNYIDKEAFIKIELLDEIQFLQSIKMTDKIYLQNINALELFNNLASKFPYQVTALDDVSKRLPDIKISKINIDNNDWWTIWESFCTGTRTIFYKDANNIYRLGE